jgi:hypothetical protein
MTWCACCFKHSTAALPKALTAAKHVNIIGIVIKSACPVLFLFTHLPWPTAANLASVLKEVGKLGEAEELYRGVLEVHTQVRYKLYLHPLTSAYKYCITCHVTSGSRISTPSALFLCEQHLAVGARSSMLSLRCSAYHLLLNAALND